MSNSPSPPPASESHGRQRQTSLLPGLNPDLDKLPASLAAKYQRGSNVDVEKRASIVFRDIVLASISAELGRWSLAFEDVDFENRFTAFYANDTHAKIRTNAIRFAVVHGLVQGLVFLLTGLTGSILLAPGFVINILALVIGLPILLRALNALASEIQTQNEARTAQDQPREPQPLPNYQVSLAAWVATLSVAYCLEYAFYINPDADEDDSNEDANSLFLLFFVPFIYMCIFSKLLIRFLLPLAIFHVLLSWIGIIISGSLNGGMEIAALGPVTGYFIGTLVLITMPQYALERYVRLRYHKVDGIEKRKEAMIKEKMKSELLLANVMPLSVAKRLMDEDKSIADGFTDVTVLFADIVGFTKISEKHPPPRVVAMLNRLFTQFDAIISKHKVEKIKTLGDCVELVGGAPDECPDHAERVIRVGLEMAEFLRVVNEELQQTILSPGDTVNVRVGIHSGPVIAGIIGVKKFIYDLWGDTVTYANTMESSGKPGMVHISSATYKKVKHRFEVTDGGCLAEKKGTKCTLTESHDGLLHDDCEYHAYFVVREKSLVDIAEMTEINQPQPTSLVQAVKNKFKKPEDAYAPLVPDAQDEKQTKQPSPDVEEEGNGILGPKSDITLDGLTLDDLKSADVHPRWLTFDNEELERRFMLYHNKNSVRFNRILAFCGIIIMPIYYEMNNIGIDPDMRTVSRILRYGVMVPVFLFWIWRSYSPRIERELHKMMFPTMTIIIILSITFNGFNVYDDGNYTNYTNSSFIYIFGIFLGSSMFYRQCFQSSMVYMVVVLMLLIGLNQAPAGTIIVTFIPIILVEILCVHIKKSMERGERRNFQLELIIELESEKLKIEKERNEGLLLNVLPMSIAERLKNDEKIIADEYKEVSIAFVEIGGIDKHFDQSADPENLVKVLNDIISKFDRAVVDLGLEKIKSIGSVYMVASGIPDPRKDHCEALVNLSIRIQEIIREVNQRRNIDLEVRIGLNSGPVVAGVIGTRKFAYDLWGDAVNMSARMCQHGVYGRIQLSEGCMKHVQGKFPLEDRGMIKVKGKGEVAAFMIQQ